MTAALRWLATLVLVSLSACAVAPHTDADAPIAADLVAPGAENRLEAWSPLGPADAPWRHQSFPGKPPTQFGYTHKDGRAAMLAVSVSSASMLRRSVNIAPELLSKIDFSWNVPALIPGADMSQRDTDDCPVRLVLAFEGDRSKFSPKNAMLNELARALTGEQMPYATLMYVWSHTRPPGSVILNPRTDRIRKIVVETGESRLGRWLDYERDIRADFEKAFGEPPGALVGVGIMTDSDNTQSHATAWYGPIRLLNAQAASKTPAK